MAAGDRSVEDLEAQIAYIEKMFNDLSEVVASQGRQIDQMKVELEVLGREILQITEGEAGTH